MCGVYIEYLTWHCSILQYLYSAGFKVFYLYFFFLDFLFVFLAHSQLKRICDCKQSCNMLLAVCFHAVITSALPGCLLQLLLLLLPWLKSIPCHMLQHCLFISNCTFGVFQLPIAMQSRFRIALCAGTKQET